MSDLDLPTEKPERITMEFIQTLGERLDAMNQRIKGVVFRPEGQKAAPVFNASQLAALCGKSSNQMSKLLEKADSMGLPKGAIADTTGAAKPRKFTLAEVRQWVIAVKGEPKPENADAAVVTIGNFKGGVGKTVNTASLAQGLSLKGYRVLVIDYDPQGSLTSLFGITPSEVREEDTVMPLMVPRSASYASETLFDSIKPTYWDGIDIIPGSNALFSGEFYLPMRQMNTHKATAEEKDFKFYEVLDNALKNGLKSEFDIILIDTPPQLSYMTMTAIWAADGLLMPLPPEGLDFASSGQFWTMLSEISSGTTQSETTPKTFAFLGVFPSKVNHNNMQTKQILTWMKAGYQDLLLSSEIPATAAVSVGGMELSTVYDISKYSGSQKTLERARLAFDSLVDEVEYLIKNTVWAATQ